MNVRKAMVFLICSASFALPVSLAAQSGYVPTNPITQPTVSPPAMAPMPTVTPPVVTGPTVTSPSSATPAKTATGTSAANTNAAGGTSGASTAASALSLLGLDSDNALLQALNGSNDDEDSLDALSSLLGGSSSASSTTSGDSATLAKVLSLLEKQDAEKTTASAASAKAATAKTAYQATVTAAARPVTSGGEIVRFSINGMNIQSGITVIVSSILARDGSFLLTGDRSYAATTGTLSETFYLLCRKNADGTYRLYSDVSQPTLYESSFLYRLARAGPLKGNLTGDLLVFRHSSADLSADLVIRVIDPSVR